MAIATDEGHRNNGSKFLAMFVGVAALLGSYWLPLIPAAILGGGLALAVGYYYSLNSDSRPTSLTSEMILALGLLVTWVLLVGFGIGIVSIRLLSAAGLNRFEPSAGCLSALATGIAISYGIRKHSAVNESIVS